MSAHLPFLLLLLLSLCAALASSSLLDNHWKPASIGRLPSSTDCQHEPTSNLTAGVDTAMGPSALSTAHSVSKQSHALARLEDAGETEVKTGEFVWGTMPTYGTYHYFSYKPASLNVPLDIFVGIGSCDNGGGFYCDIHLLMNGSPFANADNATYHWHYSTSIRIDSSHPLSCEYRNIPLSSCVYHYSLYSYSTNQQYFTTIMLPPPGVAELRSGITQTGTLDGGASAYYYVVNGALEDIMVFALTVTAGECDLYVSITTSQPGPNNFTWSSRYDGDDLVIINGTNIGPGGSPGIYYFVGVHNSRSTRSSYAVVGSGYSVTGSPLDNAWYLQADTTQKDYAMANTYRYYYIYVEGVWPMMTITLDSLQGDADMSELRTYRAPHVLPSLPCSRRCCSLCVRPCVLSFCSYANVRPWNYNSDESTFPTMDSSQYNSTTSGLDQLNITAPQAGYYVFIAVYSKGVDSRYSILVSGEGRITTLYTYGWPITAEISARRSLYYVLTVPNYFQMSEYMLAFTLHSTSGNTDLFISDTYMYPNATHHNWTSQLAGDGLDMAVLRGDVASGGTTQVHAGNYYASVYATTYSTFQLWAYLRLRQYLQMNSFLSYYHYGGVLYWEVEVPRGAEFSIVATPLAFYGGSFNLYVGNLAEPMPSIASTFQIRVNGAVRVTQAASPCVGDGPTCHYYIAVERVNAANETTYASFNMFVYSPDVPPLQLTPDVPLEKTAATAGGMTYQFNVTCPRAKVAITLVTTGIQRGGNAPMSINRGPLPPFASLDNIEFGYAETVAAGLRTFTLSFDWTHPLLRGKSMVGRYMLTVLPYMVSGWTLLLRTEYGNCAAMPADTKMQLLMPYAATANATSLTYFSYETSARASGYMYFTLTPQNSSMPMSGLTILARADGDVPAAGYAQFVSSSMGVLQVNADPCSNGASSNITGSVCSYMLAVSSSIGSTPFFLTASYGQPLYGMDAGVPVAGSVARAASASGTVSVSRGISTVSLVTESCVGSVSVYLNYRTEAIPTSSAADVSATTVTAPTALAATPNLVNGTHLVASVVGLGAANNIFETRVLVNVSWAAASPTASSTTLTVTSYQQVNSGYARVRIPLAATPSGVAAGTLRQPTGTTGSLRYSVYMLDKTNTTDYNLRSRCGLNQAILVHTAVGLTSSSNTIELKLPVSSHRYTVGVLVDHVWRTTVSGRTSYEASSPAYMTYTPIDVRSGVKVPDDESSSSSGMPLPPPVQSSSLSPLVIVVIAVAAFVVMAVAVWVGVRHFRRQASIEGGCLLNDGRQVSSLPSDSLMLPHKQQSLQVTGEAYYAMPAGGQ